MGGKDPEANCGRDEQSSLKQSNAAPKAAVSEPKQDSKAMTTLDSLMRLVGGGSFDRKHSNDSFEERQRRILAHLILRAFIFIIVGAVIGWWVSKNTEYLLAGSCIGAGVFSLLCPYCGKYVDPANIRKWFGVDPTKPNYVLDRDRPADLKKDDNGQLVPLENVASPPVGGEYTCYVVNHDGLEFWDWNNEREFLETHVHTRFNFLLIFVGLVLAGVPQIKVPTTVYILCIVGGLLVKTVGLTVERLHARLEVILASFHLIPWHPARQTSKLVRHLADDGHLVSVRMVHTIGVWLPRALAMFCFVSAPFFYANAVKAESGGDDSIKQLSKAIQVYSADAATIKVLEDAREKAVEGKAVAETQRDNLQKKINNLPPDVRKEFGLN